MPTHDLPDVGLCAGDTGAIVQLYPSDTVGVEFVTASGRTQALLTLCGSDVRAVRDDDLLSVHPRAAAGCGITMLAGDGRSGSSLRLRLM